MTVQWQKVMRWFPSCKTTSESQLKHKAIINIFVFLSEMKIRIKNFEFVFCRIPSVPKGRDWGSSISSREFQRNLKFPGNSVNSPLSIYSDDEFLQILTVASQIRFVYWIIFFRENSGLRLRSEAHSLSLQIPRNHLQQQSWYLYYPGKSTCSDSRE